jgi:hypothetical protein
MNARFSISLFAANYLVLFGLGLMFIRTEDERIMLGAGFAAVGLTWLVYLADALRKR